MVRILDFQVDEMGGHSDEDTDDDTDDDEDDDDDVRLCFSLYKRCCDFITLLYIFIIYVG